MLTYTGTWMTQQEYIDFIVDLPRRPPKFPHLWPLQNPPPLAGDVAA